MPPVVEGAVSSGCLHEERQSLLAGDDMSPDIDHALSMGLVATGLEHAPPVLRVEIDRARPADGPGLLVLGCAVLTRHPRDLGGLPRSGVRAPGCPRRGLGLRPGLDQGVSIRRLPAQRRGSRRGARHLAWISDEVETRSEISPEDGATAQKAAAGIVGHIRETLEGDRGAIRIARVLTRADYYLAKAAEEAKELSTDDDVDQFALSLAIVSNFSLRALAIRCGIEDSRRDAPEELWERCRAALSLTEPDGFRHWLWLASEGMEPEEIRGPGMTESMLAAGRRIVEFTREVLGVPPAIQAAPQP